ncbi:MAG TPA: NAD(P)-binding domain-containing protein [Candidatus Dormibacteraeota bacterium]|nr:NAD(P)-binding domain-containing protein [Candidatus Dormibacteraeota bacterium]
MQTESIETVVIGGGQAGLSVGYHLRQQRCPFVILDAGERIGDAWRNRWDSLLLFTPAHLCGLDGMRFPGPAGVFPTKDQMADFLESYASRFELPVRNGVRVTRLARAGQRFVVEAGDARFEANNVVVAMSSNQVSWVPPLAAGLGAGITQLTAKDYRNPAQLQQGGVLVVGVGNSGADIALEVAKTHPTWLAGKESGHIPFRTESLVARHVLVRIVRFLQHNLLSVKTPVGRKLRPKMMSTAVPLVRVKPKDLVKAGVTRVARVSGVDQGLPVTEEGQLMDVRNVVWCTGFRPGFSWIDLPVLGDRQEPQHRAGIVAQEPGLYFVGLHFLYSLTSEQVNGVGRDARRIVRQIVGRQAQPAGTRQKVPAGAALVP